MEHTLEALATYLNGRLIGDGTIRIQAVNNLEQAREGVVGRKHTVKRRAKR